MAKSLIKKGYNRIKEKIRAIRKSYNKAVTNGTRSCSGKVVQEYYDQLAKIWKGSPSTEQLGFGISSNSSENSEAAPNTSSSDPVELDNSLLSELQDTPPEPREDPLLDASSDDDDNDEGDYNFIYYDHNVLIKQVFFRPLLGRFPSLNINLQCALTCPILLP